MSVRRKGGGRLAEVETHFFHHITAHSAFSDFPAASQRKTFLFKPIFRASSLPSAPLKLDIFIFIHVYDFAESWYKNIDDILSWRNISFQFAYFFSLRSRPTNKSIIGKASPK